jgi:hypothetical protein
VFNLRQTVKEVLGSSTMADPTDIADEVLRRIDRKDYPAALAQAMRPFVRQMVSESRPPLGDVPMPAAPGQAPLVGTPFHVRLNYRNAWQKALLSRETDPTIGKWMFLRDATAQNLENMAAHRETQAEKNRHKARQLRALRDAVIEHGVETVGDLPAETLMPLLGGQAA